jgi:RNA polymerase sigma-70 factor, ECF subfamily
MGSMPLVKTPTALASPLEWGHTESDAAPRDVEENMMRAFLRNEPAVAAAIHARYAPRIYGLGLVLLKNRADAEDLVQDTFLKVWRVGSTFDPLRGSLDGWILMIARGLAIDLLRRRTLEAKKLSSEPRHSEASHEPGPERCAEYHDSIARARKAMDQLPERQRTALELAYLGDRTSTQVARLEGIPLGTAKSRIRKGIANLREVLLAGDICNSTITTGRTQAECALN